MTVTYQQFCASCGAENRGTRFCETCGAPARTATALIGTPVAVPIAAEPTATGPDPRQITAHRLRVALLVSYLVTPTLVALSAAAGAIGMLVVMVLLLGAQVLLGVLMSVYSTAVPGRRAAAIVLVVLSVLVGQVATGFFLAQPEAALYLSGVGLFAAWAISSGLRPRAYFIILIGFGFAVAYWFAGGLTVYLYYTGLWVLGALTDGVLWAALVIASLAIVRVLDPSSQRRMEARKPAVAAPQSDRTNTLAILALIFGLLTSVIVPIVLGHLARGQIRRTGERGLGMATTGLVLGYVWLAAWIVGAVLYSVYIGTLWNSAY